MNELENLNEQSKDLHITDALINFLKIVFNDSVNNVSDLRELDYAKGQQSVISLLEQIIEEQDRGN